MEFRSYRQQLFEGVNDSGSVSAIGFPDDLNIERARETIAYVGFRANCTAGVIAIEEAPYVGYTGTWVSIGSVTFSAADKMHRVASTGIHSAIRARVTTAVDGDGADVWIVAN